jgi:hypothetical protein
MCYFLFVNIYIPGKLSIQTITIASFTEGFNMKDNIFSLPIISRIRTNNCGDYATSVADLAGVIAEQVLHQQRNHSPIDVELATINEYTILNISNKFNMHKTQVIQDLNINIKQYIDNGTSVLQILNVV